MKLNNGEADDNPHGERANEEPMQQEGSSKKRRKRKKKKKLLKGNTETQSNDEIQDEGKGILMMTKAVFCEMNLH